MSQRDGCHSYTPEQDAAILAMALGDSHALARRFGVTRCAILGRRHRLKGALTSLIEESLPKVVRCGAPFARPAFFHEDLYRLVMAGR